MNLLLQPMESTIGSHSADDFSSYFTGKVDTIRAFTAGAPPPTIRPRPVPSLRCFDGVTVDEVTSLILRVTPTLYDLDPVPTWLVKKCCDILAPVITSMTSMSVRQGVFRIHINTRWSGCESRSRHLTHWMSSRFGQSQISVFYLN